MIIYFAGAEAYPEMLIDNGATNWLIAYPSKKIVEYNHKATIFVDSGAYSVYTGKKIITHQKYIDYLKHLNNNHYASLDVIGDPEASKRNYLEEVKQGLKPIPTFHQGESLRYLEYYLDHCDYISLGGLVGIGTGKMIPFIEKCFSVIAKRNNKVKVHAFGILSWEMLSKYPFYSADGTSWFAGSKRGNVLPFGSDWLKTSQLNICARNIKGFDKALSVLGSSFMNYCHNDESDQERVIRGRMRNEYNIKKYLELETFLTELWKERGVVYE